MVSVMENDIAHRESIRFAAVIPIRRPSASLHELQRFRKRFRNMQRTRFTMIRHL